ncbi:DUF1643 domain-containing protein [Thalassoporum mexicanum]|nr:DUF1643 domain-containing protein [Pseudanabaena sp. PCC 7367]
MKRSAIIDLTKQYRYLLRREWDITKPQVVFIMLNPSPANEQRT